MSDCDADQDYFDDNDDYIDDYDDYLEEEEVKVDTSKMYLACENKFYQKHNVNTIVESIKSTIENIAQLNGISEGRAFLILRACNYDKSKCDIIPQSIIDDIFYAESHEVSASKNTKECLLCYDEFNIQSPKYSLDCNHNFCKESCFKQYMQACLSEGQNILTKTCPMVGCKERIGLKEFQQFFKNEKERSIINKFLINDALSHTTLIVQCPHTNCEEIFDFGQNSSVNGVQLNLKCTCESGYFCNLCKEDAHLPCNCDMLKKWMELIQGKSSLDLNSMWLKINTKPCPKCKIPIQKNQGCMHMNCKQCNFHFCWLCLGEYVNHNDFYSCNKYNADANKNTSTDEEEKLKKYEFFTDRFKDHLGAVRLTQKEASQHIKHLQDCLKNTDIPQKEQDKSTEFYIHAYDILIEAKKCIAYTYPIGYYIDQHKKEYFEFLQGQLESNLNPFEEQLSLVDFDSILNKQQTLNQFYEYSARVTEATQKIKNYLFNMMKDLGEELPDLKSYKSVSKKISKKVSKIQQQKIVDKSISKNQEQTQNSQPAYNNGDIDIVCDDCKINPMENDYGLCNACLGSRYQ